MGTLYSVDASTGNLTTAGSITSNSTSSGFLLPRLTTTQRNAIVSPATGLEIFNTTTNQIEFYNGTAWAPIGTVVSFPITVAEGGTGLTSLTIHDLLLGNGTSNVTLVPPGATNTALVSNGVSSDPSFQTIVNSLTGTSNQISVSASTGSITLSTPQNINTASSPTFAGLSLTGDQTITVSDSSTTEVLLALTNNGSGQAVMSFTADTVTNYIGTNTNGGFYMATAEPIGINSFLFYAGGILQLASSGSITLEPATSVVVANGNLQINTGNIVLQGTGVNQGQLTLGGLTPAATASLDIQSTTRGFLPPRMTTTQKNAIVSPATGLVIYDSTLNKLCVFTGTVWETVTSA
jgi:hypothetical protein